MTTKQINRQKADALLRKHAANETFAHHKRRVQDVAAALRSVAHSLEYNPDDFIASDDVQTGPRTVRPEPVGGPLEIETFGAVNMGMLSAMVTEMRDAKHAADLADKEARELGV
jgi:hypothetical protein